MPNIAEAKKLLRRRMSLTLAAMSADERAQKSSQIIASYIARENFKSAKTIMAYSSFGAEVKTRGLLEACLKSGKRLILPRLNMETRLLEPVEILDLDRDLVCAQYGFCEPRAELKEFSPLIDIDEIAVPGMAFDLKLNRLGRGLGCYDKFLDGQSSSTCGLAFECQIVAAVPVDEHDQPLISLVTESRTL